MNPLRKDPTRTTMLRKRYVSEMNKRFRRLKGDIRELLIEKDALGLILRKKEITNTTSITANIEPEQWRFAQDDAKVDQFTEWLKERTTSRIQTKDAKGRPWMAEYIDSSYKQGATRAYMDARPEYAEEELDFAKGTKEQFLRSAFERPERKSKAKMLWKRAYNELEGVSEQMGSQLSRTLADGIIDGKGAYDIAEEINKSIDKITRTRARTIARTEIIHAHAEGQLDGFEELGIEEVGVEVEWMMTDDDRVCERCAEMDGKRYTIDEARGMIPKHPNCRCAYVPAPKDEKEDIWRKKRPKPKKAVEQEEVRDAYADPEEMSVVDYRDTQKTTDKLLGERKELKSAVDFYTGSGMGRDAGRPHRAVNRALSHESITGELQPPDPAAQKGFAETAKISAQNFREAFKRDDILEMMPEAKKAIKTHRGMNVDQSFIDSLRIGEKLKNKGLTSTTQDPLLAQESATGEDQAMVMDITVPEGKKFLSTESVTREGSYEMLFGPDTELVVEDKSFDEVEKVWRVRARMGL